MQHQFAMNINSQLIHAKIKTIKRGTSEIRVAEVGSLSSGAKMAMEIFVNRVFTIFATNASFLRVIANLQISLSKICNIYHVIIRGKIAYVGA